MKDFVLPLDDGGKKEGGGRTGEFGQLEIEVQLAEHTTGKNNLVIQPGCARDRCPGIECSLRGQ